MMENINLALGWLEQNDLTSVVLIFLLFLFPRILNRLGIPLAIGAFSAGMLLSTHSDYFQASQVVPTFAFLGVISLFAFAGMEVEVDELKEKSRALLSHVAIRVTLIAATTLSLAHFLQLDLTAAIIFALALLTPSAGFILDSLNELQMPDERKEWIKITAIATELIALATLVLTQAQTFLIGIISLLAIVGIAVVLPRVFRLFAVGASKVSSGTDFTFLLLLAVILGTITKKMGAYYLVGAFIVGVSLRLYLRSEKSEESSELVSAVRYFSAFFMPFYFFFAGLRTGFGVFEENSLLIGLALLAIFAPIRIGFTVLHRKFVVGDSGKGALTVATSLLPTLVFGLVLTEILNTKYHLSQDLIGGLTIYTLLITTLSPLVLRYSLKETSFAELAESDSTMEFPREIRGRRPTLRKPEII